MLRTCAASASAAVMGLTLCALPGPAIAEGTCGTAEQWVTWQAQNREDVLAYDSHIDKAKSLLQKERVNLNKVSDNIFAAGEHLLKVTPSPDGTTSSLLVKSGRMFEYSSRALDQGRLKTFRRQYVRGLKTLDQAGDSLVACQTELAQPTG